ncbi:O-methyltransferase [Quillaja saponaria]|uniref:O-methyltransferase n=1 Tax=Quillaja saponaria TaxID=32244 RepID=A0AAD7PVC5_QUISA|nr:O-methyltransferase [Quillaja saponaria]
MDSIHGTEARSDQILNVGGDMFQSIPPADAVLMNWVLHDWSDDECIKILKKCREAISSKGEGGGKVIIIDVVINEDKEDHELTETKLYYDINTMAVCNGQETNEKQWERLFLDAGFRHYMITPSLFGFRSLIEVFS